MFEDFYLKIELIDPNAKMPTRACEGDAGCDIYTPEQIVIPAGRDLLIPTGWRYEMPDGYVMVIQNKSGIATKKKLFCGANTCDARYRGIVHVHLFNHDDKPIMFEKHEKIAQFVIYPIWYGKPIEGVVNINTERGEGGFGSTGNK